MTSIRSLLFVMISATTTNWVNYLDESQITDHFYFQKATLETTRWVLILPGASGLKIFKDKNHYFETAKELKCKIQCRIGRLQIGLQSFMQKSKGDNG